MPHSLQEKKIEAPVEKKFENLPVIDQLMKLYGDAEADAIIPEGLSQFGSSINIDSEKDVNTNKK